MSSRQLSPGAFAALTAVLVLVQLAASATTLRNAAPAIFQGPPARTVTRQYEDAVRAIRGWIPEIEPILYLGDTDDGWLPRVWERALGPQPVAIVMSAQTNAADVARLRKVFRIQWALSVGAPPVDPGFAWHVTVSQAARSGQEAWFGRLAK